jgi:hypothetical protein
MLWILLTAGDLEAVMTSSEREDFGTADAALSGITDRAVPIVADIVQEIRGMLASNQSNKLSADPLKIPPSFKRHALNLARWSLLTSIPGYQPGEARKLEFEAAQKFFDLVRQGKIRPEEPDDAVTPVVPSEQPAGAEWTAPGSRTGRDRMQGF